MAVFHNIDNLPSFNNAVLTIGTFDGVHQGHRVILKEVVVHAAKVGGESVLITFDPHPRKLLFPDQPLGIITPLEEKERLLHEAGIAHIIVVPFTQEFAHLSAREYVEEFLVGKFKPHSIVIGYDHHFGHDRKGNIDMLKEYAPVYNYQMIEIPAQLIEAAAVSSTRIRNAIKEGRVEDAAHMLARDYSLKGTVVHGNKLGRTIGYPTANLQLLDNEQIMPAIGVYAIRARYKGVLYGAMMSIGYNPTVTDKKEVRIEANLFDFDMDIYGDELEIIFVKRLRNEQKFDSLEALVEQIHQDKRDTLEVLGAQ
ncbi:riboflavin biosynthesis protein RibF [Flavipsychrobacter stenotrophus]|uniref:Riboflavin biosynthesis protein n=1 Tax=Flavipsychrobacter stenotrophus TaxID=2077091 RepID=A0A2S7SPR9_9BACT|nr:bifunctional riboflavin kinase/FAD synthetase [Flavipsychrobacter stenotrophus]PQJ08892.1 riboflavin biosynthesis protein RibF [Flavipsychrobacter stenotrophus]